MIPDKRDQRLFRHYAKLLTDGSVAAVVEVASGAEQPATESGDYIEVTAIYPYDTAKIDALIQASPIAQQIGKQRGR